LADLKDLLSIQLFFAFVVPGVIATYMRAQFLTGRVPKVKENIFELIVLSAVYYSIFIVFLQPIVESLPGPRLARQAAWVALTVFGPAVFGALLGVAALRHWFASFANLLKVSMIHAVPSAWDWHFNRIRDDCYVLVTLTNGDYVAGYYGSDSFASSDGGERDLYIQEALDWNEEQGWKERTERTGILLLAREIRHVQFFRLGE
jgi:hypothetical protein